jgi:hypothetical protein
MKTSADDITLHLTTSKDTKWHKLAFKLRGGIYSSSGTNIFPRDIFRGTIILPYAQIFLRAFGAQISK